MKRIQLSIMLLCVAAMVLAVPAKPGLRPYTQPDGSTVMLELHGDAFFHYFTNEKGEWVTPNQDGMFLPCEALSDSMIIAARKASPRKVAAAQAAANKGLNLAPRGLVILVNFSDIQFQEENTHHDYDDLFNSDNYNYNGAYGSVRKYFIDQSMGQYTPHFDVVGPVNLTHDHTYYGENDFRGNDKNAEQMIYDACMLADSQFDIDFTQYDNDHDGKVDFVYIIYAGRGEADGGASTTIWPHNYYLSYSKRLFLDGKQIDNYACSNELSANSRNIIVRNGVGTPCHEFSHVCGLPDLYCTNDYANIKTLGKWDVLDAGSYCGDDIGNCPTGYSGYERFFCGWTKPILLTQGSSDTLPNLQESNKVYIITENGTHNMDGFSPNPATFFVLENRQRVGWDANIPGHGMLITKVQYNSRQWTYNEVNTSTSSMGVDIIEADNRSSASYANGKQGDAFPYLGSNYIIDSYSPFPDAPITAIVENNKIITFDFKGGHAPINNALLENGQLKEGDQIIEIYKVYSPLLVVLLPNVISLNDLEPGDYIIRLQRDGIKRSRFNIKISITQ